MRASRKTDIELILQVLRNHSGCATSLQISIETGLPVREISGKLRTLNYVEKMPKTKKRYTTPQWRLIK